MDEKYSVNRRKFLQQGAIVPVAAALAPGSLPGGQEGTARMKLALGNDDRGFPVKDFVLKLLRSWNYPVKDCGCFSTEPADFPDIAKLVAEEILSGRAERGIMICGTGQGAVMAGNKIPGIRAALCHDAYCAHQCVEHDNANMICFGAQIIGPMIITDVLHYFLNAQFSTDETFRRRVRKLELMDQRAAK
jgi:ribose 5-phosphate isomerase B